MPRFSQGEKQNEFRKSGKNSRTEKKRWKNQRNNGGTAVTGEQGCLAGGKRDHYSVFSSRKLRKSGQAQTSFSAYTDNSPSAVVGDAMLAGAIAGEDYLKAVHMQLFTGEEGFLVQPAGMLGRKGQGFEGAVNLYSVMEPALRFAESKPRRCVPLFLCYGL